MAIPETVEYPRIHLALDNCFASKRWTQPDEWMQIARDVGIFCVEASADTGCDPLYMGTEYLTDWVEDVRKNTQRHSVRVVNLYSGHGTYATLGLGHPDERIRRRMADLWLKPLIDIAQKLGAGVGFFCHAFPAITLKDAGLYRKAEVQLEEVLAEVARYAADRELPTCCVEQMYTPHQPPWTIRGARDLLSAVFRRAKAPFYLTIDTGHQLGQSRFLRSLDGDETARNAHLYADETDCSTYNWLLQLGRYSPIVHLQQTVGERSSHLAFTDENNRIGNINALRVIESLKKSFETEWADGMPPNVQDMYLTLEVFAGTEEREQEILDKIAASVHYWREFIPEDGKRLNELV